ncbi:hypothetical protein [Streptomyces gobiensis]|uniref:hypothetical protein n=1 Tax=Streptomyces gobiensis TaxID=2875706 RepID=UPI001E316699|nr:hypothetical protein [Streptomyces gobiensis]UGY93256.1 hypothetical protein test1122_17055 [Streptomyces gobiensis]
MNTTVVLVNVLVVASVAVSLSSGPHVGERNSKRVGSLSRWSGPAVVLAVVTGMIFLNQVLFTIYVVRVHSSDVSFIARYFPEGWFALADGNPVLQWLAVHFPFPELLAPSVLRVQAFLELPFVIFAFLVVLRWLDPRLYRRTAQSSLAWAASASYTAAFCAVEWDLRNPYTVDDIIIRVIAALVTPLFAARLADRERAESGQRLSVVQLLLFFVSLGALGYLVLTVYETALLYNLGKLGDSWPGAVIALGVLAAARLAAGRVRKPARAGTAVAVVGYGLRRWLALFFVPALAIRYGVTFGTPVLAAGAGCLIAVVAVMLAVRDGRREALRHGVALRLPLLAAQFVLAVVAGSAAAYAAVRLLPGRSYYEAGLLQGAVAFLIVGIGVCAATDVWLRGRSLAERDGAVVGTA